MADRQKEEKRKRNAEYAKRFKKKKQKARRPAEARPSITLLPASGPFLASCARCAKEAELPFRPTGSKPVYCDACYTLIRSGAITPEPVGMVTFAPAAAEPVP
ncbi:MAG: hypothetical protein FJZ01_09820 [Candidatus Sericytochromatia bacterium]|nr:hypothetical protein [Candidatus Tanganyikabacteria bacterium]